MVSTLTPTEAGLTRAVVAEPDADLHRLAYADFLDDRDGPGDRARAEFVRVQVELAGLPECHVTTVDDGGGDPGGWPCRCPWHALRRREGVLLPAMHCHAIVRVGYVWGLDLDFPGPCPWEFRRGFVESVRVPLAAWLEHGPALVASCPLARVDLADRAPFSPAPPAGGTRVWDWFSTYFPVDETAPGPAVLPDRVFALLAPGPRKTRYGKEYDSREGALADASAALLAFARRPR
jgi:uncharacterized protein (TIGR02996 family)